MESVLLDTMYRIPSETNVVKIVVDEGVIEGVSEPILVYDNSDQVDKAITEE